MSNITYFPIHPNHSTVIINDVDDKKATALQAKIDRGNDRDDRYNCFIRRAFVAGDGCSFAREADNSRYGAVKF